MIENIYRLFTRKPSLRKRVAKLEKQLADNPITLGVPIVNERGNLVSPRSLWAPNVEYLSFRQVCKALQDMCGIEITYQEIEGKSGVVIYEKEDD